eukprot:6156583-Lingulodinium_polyedra.AAC.1
MVAQRAGRGGRQRAGTRPRRASGGGASGHARPRSWRGLPAVDPDQCGPRWLGSVGAAAVGHVACPQGG